MLVIQEVVISHSPTGGGFLEMASQWVTYKAACTHIAIVMQAIGSAELTNWLDLVAEVGEWWCLTL